MELRLDTTAPRFAEAHGLEVATVEDLCRNGILAAEWQEDAEEPDGGFWLVDGTRAARRLGLAA